MLGPDYLKEIVELTEEKVDEVNRYLTAKIVQRIMQLFGETGEVRIIPSSLLDLKKQQNAGKLLEEIQVEVEKQLPSIRNEVRRAFYDAGAKIANNINATTGEILRIEQERGNLSDVEMPEFENREKVTRASELNMTDKEISCLESAFRRTSGEIYNLTKTAPIQAQKIYIEACDNAYFKVMHGTSLDTAIVDAIKEVSKKGVTVVHYASGHEDRIEVAIARAVRTGVNQANGDITLTRCAETGINYVLVTSHIGARVTPYPDYRTHADWQGKVYSLDWNNPLLAKYQPQTHEQPKGKFSFLNKMKAYFQEQKNRKYKDFIEVCGYGKMLGICGINCRHSFGLFYPGITINNQKQFKPEENEKRYQMEQRQRAMERSIRDVKRELDAINNSGADNDGVKARKQKLKQLLQKRDMAYRTYCEENNLKPLNYRLQIAKLHGVGNTISSEFEYGYKGDESFSSGKKVSACIEEVEACLKVSQGNPTMISNIRSVLDTKWQPDKSTPSFQYNPNMNRILYNPNVDISKYDINAVSVHELTHKVDAMVYESWNNEAFNLAIRRTREYILSNEELFWSALQPGGRYFANIEINDIISAITRGKINTVFAHETSYWTDITSSAEIFANISAMDLLELDGKGEFDGFLNLIYDAYVSMVEG